jgi:hypothetical protein
VSEVLEGPQLDALDELEVSKFLETQLRRDLLRAQIRSVDRANELRAFVVRRNVVRVDCVVVLTVLALGWVAVTAAASNPRLWPELILVLGMTMIGAARSGYSRLQ